MRWWTAAEGRRYFSDFGQAMIAAAATTQQQTKGTHL
jgi:hypothetical protein